MEKPTFKSLIRRKSFLLLFFLIFNSITWFYLIGYLALKSIPQVYWLFFLVVLAAMLVGPTIAKKFDKKNFLFIWILLGVISSLSYAILPSFGEYRNTILPIFLGFAFGIGFPSCLSLIPSLTKTEERGRAGGITFFPTYAILPLLFFLTEGADIFSSSLMLAGWRSLGLGAFLLHVDISETCHPKPVSYRSVVRRQTFLLYLIPWLAFCLINYLEVPNFEQFFGESTADLMNSAAFMIGCLFCIVGGWLIDLKGRRWGIILALVVVGLGYATLSIFSSYLFAQVLFTIADGIAFGILTVTFIFVVWGDIANGERGEKFYAVGNAPIPLAIGLSTLVSSWLVELGAGSVFSLASFFLFLAIVPVFFAPELLPERIIRKRELRKYVEEAKKVAGRD